MADSLRNNFKVDVSYSHTCPYLSFSGDKACYLVLNIASFICPYQTKKIFILSLVLNYTFYPKLVGKSVLYRIDFDNGFHKISFFVLKVLMCYYNLAPKGLCEMADSLMNNLKVGRCFQFLYLVQNLPI